MSSSPPAPVPSSPTSPAPPPDSSPSRGSGEEEEEEGEELLDEKKIAEDYKAIPELDRYEAKGIDEGDYEELSPGRRRAAEREIRAREAEQRRRAGVSRVPAALMTPTDDEGEEAALQPRKVRRIGEGGIAEVEQEAEEDEGGFIELEFKGGSLKEFLAQEATRKEIRRRFKQFLTDFRDEKGTSVYTPAIQTMCTENRQSLEISYLHLSQAVPNLAVWVADEPAILLELFSQALHEMVLAIFPRYDSVHSEVHVRITRIPIVDSLRDLRQTHLNALIKVEGVVTRRTSVFPQLRLVKFNCAKCGSTLGPYAQNQEKEVSPSKCPECQSQGPFSINMQQTIYQNYQRITLQETPGSVPAGRVPRQKDIILLYDLIDSVSPGEEIEVTGIYKHSYDTGLNIMHGFPVFNTVILANYVAKRETWATSLQLTDDDTKNMEKLSKKPNIGDIIINSIAPSIYGHKNIKMALAMAMFGGVPKTVMEKGRLRGDINILILGDPGTAKSQFLKYIEKTAHRAVYTTGKGASAVGLTASVRRDPLTREWTLEGGALVLADNGVCLIDEFDKMNDQDRTSIHEAMEQQSISISKAGIITTLKARCAVIAAANPIKGRYDSQVSFQENVELTDAILSRFDILCVVRDQVDREYDTKLAQFVVDSHMQSHPLYDPSKDSKLESKQEVKDQDELEKLDQETLRKYIMYAKKNCSPKLLGVDEAKIEMFYKELRRESSSSGGIPIAVRHIESLIRMAEAHARMHLRSDVTEDDVNTAIRVMLDSFIQSQKYSVKNALQKHFQKYITYKRDSFELLLYILQNLVHEAIQFRLIRGLRRSDSSEEPVEIPCEEFEARARELHITNPEPFYKSKLFTSNGFRHDKDKKLIIKSFE